MRLSSEWNNCSFGTVDVDTITKKVAEYNKALTGREHDRWITRPIILVETDMFHDNVAMIGGLPIKHLKF